jgi:hypothetical protein
MFAFDLVEIDGQDLRREPRSPGRPRC